MTFHRKAVLVPPLGTYKSIMSFMCNLKEDPKTVLIDIPQNPNPKKWIQCGLLLSQSRTAFVLMHDRTKKCGIHRQYGFLQMNSQELELEQINF